jgi:hypothetical protein
MTSRVRPLCDNPMATSPGPRRAALVRALCASSRYHTGMRMRSRRNAISRAAAPLLPRPNSSTRPATAIASARRATPSRSRRAAVSWMARESAPAMMPSTRSSGSSGPISCPMSVSHRACSCRPLSAARATRSEAYPLKPSTRQNRVTVAVEVPARSARSTIDACAASAGSSRICSATRASASGRSGSSARSRPTMPWICTAVIKIPFTNLR